MELYDKQFVFFDWDDKLDGKKGFFSDNINSLKQYVKDNGTLWSGKICNNLTRNTDYPFRFIDESGNSHCFRFCYYDPYYEFRKAYIEGKQLQFKDSAGNWRDVEGEPIFTRDEYRIKPDDIIWKVVLSGDGGVLGIAKTTDKHIYFEGTAEECGEWIDKHKHLADLMKSWEEGKTIQYLHDDEWIDVANNIPLWGLNNTYRVKPDECEGCMKYDYCMDKNGIRCKSYCTTVYVPFDTVQELIEVWDNKYPQSKNRPEGTMPLIWIKSKRKNRVYLITDFLFEKAYNCDVGTEDENFSLKELFEDYTFADGSIIGKVKE